MVVGQILEQGGGTVQGRKTYRQEANFQSQSLLECQESWGGAAGQAAGPLGLPTHFLAASH